MAAAPADTSPSASLEAKPDLGTNTLSVFTRGNYPTKCITVDTSNSSSPPKPLFIVVPDQQGTYKVIVFFPGTSLSNISYSQLFEHIASHGFIVVAPQLYPCLPPCGNKEVNSAVEVINWLSKGIQSNLPENVIANLNLVALMGHSRGGKTAFAVAHGYAKADLQFSAIVGVDPVAGTGKITELEPPILSVDSFNFTIPVTVIGTGLGGVARCVIPCAPEGANYEEFFNKSSKSSRARFVTADYGHMDVLDDNPSGLMSRVLSKCWCKNGTESRDPMRRCVGGITVAFLKDYFDDEPGPGDFKKIVEDPSVAPIKLESVVFIEA